MVAENPAYLDRCWLRLLTVGQGSSYQYIWLLPMLLSSTLYYLTMWSLINSVLWNFDKMNPAMILDVSCIA